jgi:hypothetical protein
VRLIVPARAGVLVLLKRQAWAPKRRARRKAKSTSSRLSPPSANSGVVRRAASPLPCRPPRSSRRRWHGQSHDHAHATGHGSPRIGRSERVEEAFQARLARPATGAAGAPEARGPVSGGPQGPTDRKPIRQGDRPPPKAVDESLLTLPEPRAGFVSGPRQGCRQGPHLI